MWQYDEDLRGMVCCHKGRIGDGHFCYHELMFQIGYHAKKPKLTLVHNTLNKSGGAE